jgi:hypothetical protein
MRKMTKDAGLTNFMSKFSGVNPKKFRTLSEVIESAVRAQLLGKTIVLTPHLLAEAHHASGGGALALPFRINENAAKWLQTIESRESARDAAQNRRNIFTLRHDILTDNFTMTGNSISFNRMLEVTDGRHRGFAVESAVDYARSGKAPGKRPEDVYIDTLIAFNTDGSPTDSNLGKSSDIAQALKRSGDPTLINLPSGTRKRLGSVTKSLMSPSFVDATPNSPAAICEMFLRHRKEITAADEMLYGKMLSKVSYRISAAVLASAMAKRVPKARCRRFAELLSGAFARNKVEQAVVRMMDLFERWAEISYEPRTWQYALVDTCFANFIKKQAVAPPDLDNHLWLTRSKRELQRLKEASGLKRTPRRMIQPALAEYFGCDEVLSDYKYKYRVTYYQQGEHAL